MATTQPRSGALNLARSLRGSSLPKLFQFESDASTFDQIKFNNLPLSRKKAQ
jgi:hypothetical protein